MFRTFLLAASLFIGATATLPAVLSGKAAEQSPATAPGPGPGPTAAEGLVTIESDSQQADNQTGIVTAIGNVRITYPDRGMVATSRQAQYFSREGRLVLTGDVDVVDADGQRIRAERLTYNLDQERLVAQPSSGQQVTSKIRLKSASSPRVGPPMP